MNIEPTNPVPPVDTNPVPEIAADELPIINSLVPEYRPEIGLYL